MLDIDFDSPWALVVLFLAGALPPLEAVLVIPGAVLAGFSPVTSVLVAGGGNVLTVGIAAYAGEWIRETIRAWRSRRRNAKPNKETPRIRGLRRAKALRRRETILKVMDRGGLPLLALVGPLGLGTHISAIAAVALGLGATRSFFWVGLGTVFWSITTAVLASFGLDLFGGVA